MVLLKRDTLETLLEQQYERPERAEELPDWESFISFTDDYGSDHGDEAIYEAVLQLYQFCQSQPFPVAWLQRQQADAIIAARTRIVAGAVGMVEMALDELQKNGVVQLDEERKAQMVSNLLVVLCGERSTQPIVNTGSLY